MTTPLYNHLVITATSKKYFLLQDHYNKTTLCYCNYSFKQPTPIGKQLLNSRGWHLIRYSSANMERQFCFCVNMISKYFRIFVLQFIERTRSGQDVPQDGHMRLTSQTSCILCFTSTETLLQVINVVSCSISLLLGICNLGLP